MMLLVDCTVYSKNLMKFNTFSDVIPGNPGRVLDNVVQVGDERKRVDPPSRYVRLNENVDLWTELNLY